MLIFTACNSEEKGAKIGTKAPFITAKNKNHELVKIEDFKNTSVIVFIQDGCAFCLKNLPLLDAFAKKYQLKIYAIDSISKDEVFLKMLKKLALKNIIFLQDNINITWQKYSVFAVPTIIIIKDNIVKDRIIGDKNWAYLHTKLTSFL